MIYDVVIVGGGPAGLSAALALGRARKRVLLCDAGPRRNAAAVHMHNFVTRDGISPDEFRHIGRAQLATYANVEVRDVHIESISGTRGAFHLTLSSSVIEARRILLCTGMIDELPAIEGLRELWGHAVFQCPYCHGWEVQDRPWGYLARPADARMMLPFVLMARGWTPDLVVFTSGGFEVPLETLEALRTAGIRVETTPVKRLVASPQQQLQGIELSNGTTAPCDVLFMHPAQRQVAVVRALNVATDEDGYVQIDPMKRETSIPGIYAAGDLTTRMQGAIFAAASGVHAAAMINAELMMELGLSGKL